MWLQREKGKFLENPTGTGKTKTKGHLACWLAGNANDVENAVQKKSQMRIMEEQLSKNRTGR